MTVSHIAPHAPASRITVAIELPAGTNPSEAERIADSLRSHVQLLVAPRGGRAHVEHTPIATRTAPSSGSFTRAPGQGPGAGQALPPRQGLQPVPLRARRAGVVSPNAPARRDAQAARLRLLHATAVSPASPALALSPSPAVPNVAPASRLHQAQFVIDLYGRRARIDGEDVNLTYKEFELLAFLARHAREVVTRDQLMDHVWCDASGETGERTVDVHVRRVRNKLGRYRKAISTVRGSGYRLDVGSDIAIIDG